MKPRTGDFILVATVFLVAIAIWLIPLSFNEKGEYVIVKENGEAVGEFSLLSDREEELSQLALRIENGEVYVCNAKCPDKVCEKTGRISKPGESIICIPGRVEIKIGGRAKFDAMSG